jgi:hypothetical protein
MRAEDLMYALTLTYPHDEGAERAGALAGEKVAARAPQPASPFFAQFDLDGDGLIRRGRPLDLCANMPIVTVYWFPSRGCWGAQLRGVSAGHVFPGYPSGGARLAGIAQAGPPVALPHARGAPHTSGGGQDVATVFAVLDEDANAMISRAEFAAVTGALRRRLRRVSHVSRTGLRRGALPTRALARPGPL